MLSPDIACNVAAAWRQAGASQRFGREQKMTVRTQCQTSHTPLAPNCSLGAGIFIFSIFYFAISSIIFIVIAKLKNIIFADITFINSLCYSISEQKRFHSRTFIHSECCGVLIPEKLLAVLFC